MLKSLCSLTWAIVLLPTKKDGCEDEGVREICMVVHLEGLRDNFHILHQFYKESKSS